MKFRSKDKRYNRTESFDKVLPDILKAAGLEKSFTIEAFRDIWSDVVGDIISTHSRPDRFFNDILFIAADHSIYANEIIMMKDSILKKLNDDFMILGIKKLKIEIKKIVWD